MTVRSARAVRPPLPMTLPRSSGCTRTSRTLPRRSDRLATWTSSGYWTMPRTRCSRASSSTSGLAGRLGVRGHGLLGLGVSLGSGFLGGTALGVSHGSGLLGGTALGVSLGSGLLGGTALGRTVLSRGVLGGTALGRAALGRGVLGGGVLGGA